MKKVEIALSKKDKKELQKKEIDELDSILSELGVLGQVEPTLEVVVESVVDSEGLINSTDGKKKKKKKTNRTVHGNSEGIESIVEESEVSEVSVVDIAALLKSRLKKGNVKGNVAKSDAVLEALKASTGILTYISHIFIYIHT